MCKYTVFLCEMAVPNIHFWNKSENKLGRADKNLFLCRNK